MAPDMREYLVEQLGLEETEVVDVDGLLDLEDLWSLLAVEVASGCAIRPGSRR